MKLKKINFVYLIVIYFILLIATFLSPWKILGRHSIEKGDIKLHVTYQAVTGPTDRVDAKDALNLSNMLKDKYPNINTTEVELEGNTPYHLVADPMYLGGSMTVYGKVTGTTDKYADCGDGVIPVFKVSYWDIPLRNLLLVDSYKLIPLFIIVFPAAILSIAILIFNIIRKIR